jgi:hypothetical protein
VKSPNALLCWMLLLAACQNAAAPAREPRPGPEPRARPAPSFPLLDAEWGRLQVEALALSLELPDARGWRHGGGRDWVRLVHSSSESSIEVRRFRAEATVRPEDCATRAGFPPDPPSGEEDAELLDRRLIEGHAGLRIQVTTGVGPPGPDGTLTGAVGAAAAGFRVCVALRLRTQVRGEGGAAELARRLALFTERVVPSVALIDIESRIRPPGEPEREVP